MGRLIRVTTTGSYSAIHLDFDRRFNGFSLLLKTSICLCSHDTSTPVTSVFLVFVEIPFLDGTDEFTEFILVFLSNFSEGENSGSLLVYYCSETCFACRTISVHGLP